MYLPVYIDLYNVFWTTQQGSYGAVMFALACWVIWRERMVFAEPYQGRPTGVGTSLVVIGVLLFLAGRTQNFYQFEVASQIPLLFGIVSLVMGPRAVRRLAFPIAMLAFVIPIPGSLMDELLLPLKQSVSDIVDDVLYMAGYPVARNGVVLTIGRYNLLIADACSGLNSMIALSGVGLLYVYVSARKERWLNALLILSILPIAFGANLVRVGLLALITYHFGDGAGRSFHEEAGYLEIILAFGVFFGIDRTITWAVRARAPLSAG